MAAKFEFQGTLHRNLREMHDAIAEEWLGAGGSNTPEDIAQLLKLPIEHLAAEAATLLGLTVTPFSTPYRSATHSLAFVIA